MQRKHLRIIVIKKLLMKLLCNNFIIAALFINLSCSGLKNVDNAATVLSVSDYEGNTISGSDFIHKIDSVTLRTDKGLYLSTVRDICMNDSSLFILDMSKSIFRFNVRTGLQQSHAKRIGHGKGEYVEPVALTCCDDTLFVLDIQGRTIQCYDFDLKPLGIITLDFNALDISKTQDGFLLFNPNPHGNLHRIVHTDSHGKTVGSFIESDVALDLLMTTHLFSEDGKGKTYFCDPTSNNIYIWDNGTLSEAFKLDYGTEEKQAKQSSEIYSSQKASTYNSLFTSKYIITQFEANRFIHTYIYNKATGESKSGTVRTQTAYPFMPKLVYGDCLAGVYEKPYSNDADNHTLLIYHLK